MPKIKRTYRTYLIPVLVHKKGAASKGRVISDDDHREYMFDGKIDVATIAKCLGPDRHRLELFEIQAENARQAGKELEARMVSNDLRRIQNLRHISRCGLWRVRPDRTPVRTSTRYCPECGCVFVVYGGAEFCQRCADKLTNRAFNK